jgi:hypothetical protein
MARAHTGIRVSRQITDNEDFLIRRMTPARRAAAVELPRIPRIVIDCVYILGRTSIDQASLMIT